MKRLSLILALAITLSCQVQKDKAKDEVISDNRSYTNAFTVITPTAQSYLTGDPLVLSLVFPATVTIDSTLGTPFVTINVGGSLINASYISGSGTTVINFEYTITAADIDADGINLVSFTKNGALITYMYGSTAKTCNSLILSTHFPGVLVN